jgi:sulfate permease, SulP family
MWPQTRDQAMRDVVAACALAAVAIPEQLATARLAGVPPAFGLIVFVGAALGFFLFGANRYLSAGADSTIAPILAGGLALLATSGTPRYLALAAALALMVGALVAVAGLLRLGRIARLLSVPILTGFLAGIAVHIVVSQLPALLGIPRGGSGFFGDVANIAENIGRINLFSLAIGAGVFAVVKISEELGGRFPGALGSVVAAAAAAAFFKLNVPVLGHVEVPPLMPALPAITSSDLTELLPIALIVSLVVLLQTAAVSRSFGGNEAGVNRDLMGVGVGGMLSGFLGGFAANASPPRTAIVRASGAQSRLAGFLAMVIVVLFLAFLPGLLAYVPEAALAGLLMSVALRIFDTAKMRIIARQSWVEFLLLAITAAAIVVMPIETGVSVGIALSLLYGVWTITRTHAIVFELIPGTTVWWPKSEVFKGETRPGIVVAGFQAPLFFLNAENFRTTLDQAVESAPQPVKAIVLEASSMVELDFSGAQVLAELIRSWNARGAHFYVARLISLRAQASFKDFGILPLLAHRKTFESVAEAITQCREDFPATR